MVELANVEKVEDLARYDLDVSARCNRCGRTAPVDMALVMAKPVLARATIGRIGLSSRCQKCNWRGATIIVTVGGKSREYR